MKAKFAKTVGIGLACAALCGFILLNVVAFHHACGMMRFANSGGGRTAQPEALSFGGRLRVLFAGVNLPRPMPLRTPAAFGLPYEDEMIPCAGGVRLAAWHIPADKSEILVILFHGYSAEKSSLLDEAELLHRLGLSVLLVDFRGSGGSSESLTTLGLLEADDVAEAVAWATARLPPHRRTILFGQSMGAVAILRAIAQRGVKPDGIILEAVFDTMLNTVRNRFRSLGVPSFPSAELLVFWGGRQIGFNAFKHRPVDYARSVTCPALFMQGSNDPRARPEEARRVFDAVPGVTKRWREFNGLAHESYAARRPAEWTAAIAEFIGTNGLAAVGAP